MDLYCSNCGEPWDNDEFHFIAEDFDTTYAKVTATFRKVGCAAVNNPNAKAPTCVTVHDDVTAAAFAAYEVCGDDMDGAAALMDDFIGGY